MIFCRNIFLLYYFQYRRLFMLERNILASEHGPGAPGEGGGAQHGENQKETEKHQKTTDLPWNQFRVGSKQKYNIKTFLKRRTFDSCSYSYHICTLMIIIMELIS